MYNILTSRQTRHAAFTNFAHLSWSACPRFSHSAHSANSNEDGLIERNAGKSLCCTIRRCSERFSLQIMPLDGESNQMLPVMSFPFE